MKIADNIKCKEFTFKCRPTGSRLKGMENTWEYAIYFRGKQVGTARTKKDAQKWVSAKVKAVNAVLEAARKKYGGENHDA